MSAERLRARRNGAWAGWKRRLTGRVYLMELNRMLPIEVGDGKLLVHART